MDLQVNLDVDDLDKAVRFYSSGLGLKVGRRLGAFGVEMLGSSVPIYLLVKSPETPASETISQLRSYQRHWTPVHLDFVVDEIERGVQRGIEAGAHLEQPIRGNQACARELYAQIWNVPTTKLARSYGLSDVALGKICNMRFPNHRLVIGPSSRTEKPVARPPLPNITEEISIMSSDKNPIPR